MIKKKIGEQMEKWLEKEENLEMWHDSIPAKTRRVLMTKWAGEAWRELSSDEDFVKKLFEKTGCLMTADGEDDEKVRKTTGTRALYILEHTVMCMDILRHFAIMDSGNTF